MLLPFMLFGFLCFVILIWKQSRGRLKFPPQLVGGWPVIGHIPVIMGDTRQLWTTVKAIANECIEKAGVTYGFLGPTISCYVITDADDFLVAANSCLEKNFVYEFTQPWLGDGLISVTNHLATWKRHRKIVNRAFNQKVLDAFHGIFNTQSRLLVEDFAKHAGTGLFNHCTAIEHRQMETICQKKAKALLDLLLELPSQDAFNDKEIMEEVNTMIVAGYDTSSTTMTLAMILLGSYPSCQERLFKECQEVFGDSDRDIEKQDLSRLVYLEAVIKETLRLYPITPVLPRYVSEDVQLKNYTMPAGSHCFLLVYGLHRDRKIWGPYAEEFRPERWLDPTSMPDHPAAFAGFSLGKRGCVGKTYAMMSMKVTLAHVIRRYRITGDVTKLELQLDLLLKPFSNCQISVDRR